MQNIILSSWAEQKWAAGVLWATKQRLPLPALRPYWTEKACVIIMCPSQSLAQTRKTSSHLHVYKELITSHPAAYSSFLISLTAW